jgi:predicted amidohydrolase
MKICVAQARAVKGAIQTNIEKHKLFIELAVSAGAELIIFPELSLTGYEPTLAKALATRQDDNRFDTLQQLSNTHQISIGAGAPIKKEEGICIGMILFQPHTSRQTYFKKYLHTDEEPFFISGGDFGGAIVCNTKIALAICYELSVPEHSANAFNKGAEIYIASVVKTTKGVEKAIETLSGIAGQYYMTVLLANAVGEADGTECGGKSGVWNNKGLLQGQLSATTEGLIVFDTNTGELTQKLL